MTTGNLTLVLTAAVATGLGTFLMLPHRHGRVRSRIWLVLGGALAAVGAAAFGLLLTPPTDWLASLFFYGFSLLAFAGAILMATNRNPVNIALFFAAVVLSTSGLFLLAGAQFLAAGTVIVYAGAIIVTFLFVLMLAQSEGHALYDRLARSPLRSSVVAFALLGGLLYAIVAVKAPQESMPAAESEADTAVVPRLARGSDLEAKLNTLTETGPALVYRMASTPTSRLIPESVERAVHGEPPPHVAGLGGTLFTDHLLSVEVAGSLLFVALVGAAVIVAPRRPIRPGERGLVQSTNSR